MRVMILQVIFCALLGTIAAPGVRQQPAADAQGALTELLKEIGDPRQLEAIKALTATGALNVRNQYFGKMPDAKLEFISQRFVIHVLFPDSYVQRIELANGSLIIKGFAGSKLLNRGVLRDGKPMAGYDPPNMIDTERAGFGYLVLALLLKVDSIYPFALARASHDSLVFTSPAGTEVNVEFDPSSKRVRRIAFESQVANTSGKLSGRKARTAIQLSDHREVDGLWLPHKMTVLFDGRVQMEQTYESIDLNPSLTQADFDR